MDIATLQGVERNSIELNGDPGILDLSDTVAFMETALGLSLLFIESEELSIIALGLALTGIAGEVITNPPTEFLKSVQSRDCRATLVSGFDYMRQLGGRIVQNEAIVANLVRGQRNLMGRVAVGSSLKLTKSVLSSSLKRA